MLPFLPTRLVLSSDTLNFVTYANILDPDQA